MPMEKSKAQKEIKKNWGWGLREETWTDSA